MYEAADQTSWTLEWHSLNGNDSAVCMQVSIDLFAVTRQYVDLASLACLCEPTGGQLYHYHLFSSPADDDQLYNDLRWNLQRPQVCSQDC